MALSARGKSGLKSERCRLTAEQGNLTESATENKPPIFGKGETAR